MSYTLLFAGIRPYSMRVYHKVVCSRAAIPAFAGLVEVNTLLLIWRRQRAYFGW